MAKHELMGGKLHLYKRERSSFWQCATHIKGQLYRQSTKCDGLAQAKDFAEDWYFRLRDELRTGGKSETRIFREEANSFLHEFQNLAQKGLERQQVTGQGKSFHEAAEVYLKELQILAKGERSPRYVDEQYKLLKTRVLPYFGDMQVTEILPGTLQDYRMHRAAMITRLGNPPTRSTIHQEIVVVRQTLKTAHRRGWLPMLPDLSNPFKASSKIRHRAWFSPAEYKQLYQATRARSQSPKKERWRHASEELHDYVLFMANTGLRPDEAARLELRDVTIIKENKQTILLLEVRGKRGVGYCKSMPGALLPFQRLQKRNRLRPNDRLFPGNHRALFNSVLGELKLKFDRDGNRRSAYSLRHSYICFRLLEGADIYQIAKNCRTSVQIIEQYYAAHIQNMLDASAINVRRAKPSTSTDLPSRQKRKSSRRKSQQSVEGRAKNLVAAD